MTAATQSPIRIGIRGRMFVAIGLIVAVMTAAGFIAWASYSSLSSDLTRVADVNLPSVTVAARLAEQGGIITAEAPALASAADEKERSRAWQRLDAAIHRIEEMLVAMRSQGAEERLRGRLAGRLDALSSNMRALDEIVRRRFWFAERNRVRTEMLRWLHADFLDEIEPAVIAGSRACGIGGPVIAGVVHHYEGKGTRIVLAEKRGERARDRPRLVARRHHHQHRRPRVGRPDRV